MGVCIYIDRDREIYISFVPEFIYITGWCVFFVPNLTEKAIFVQKEIFLSTTKVNKSDKKVSFPPTREYLLKGEA